MSSISTPANRSKSVKQQKKKSKSNSKPKQCDATKIIESVQKQGKTPLENVTHTLVSFKPSSGLRRLIKMTIPAVCSFALMEVQD